VLNARLWQQGQSGRVQTTSCQERIRILVTDCHRAADSAAQLKVSL